MKKNFIRLTFILLFLLLSWNCSKDNNPVNQNEQWQNDKEVFSQKLEIKTEKSEYKLEEITFENFAVIVGTLTNISKDTLYAKLGDRINASTEQDDLSIAKGTDGYFEKNISKNKWNNLNLSIMVGGSRVIRILPLKKYNVLAAAYIDSNIEGNFRLRINYYKEYTHGLVDTLSDVSNVFSISKY
jgi:hypothetical protein